MTQNNFPKNQLVDDSWFSNEKHESAKVWNEEDGIVDWKIVETAEYTRFLEAMKAHNKTVLSQNPNATAARIRKSDFDDMDLNAFNDELFG